MGRSDENYGVQRRYARSHGSGPAYVSPTVVATKSDRTWSVLAHLSTFLMLASVGVLGPITAGAIWLFKRNDSPMVASHALRSVVYQTVWLVVIAAGWAITMALTAILIGVLLWPVMALVTLAPFVHASFAAYDAYKDRNVYL